MATHRERFRAAQLAGVCGPGRVRGTLCCFRSESDEDLQNYLEMLLETAAPGKHFICGVADRAMPFSLYSRIKQMANFVTTHGQCPLWSEEEAYSWNWNRMETR